MHLFAIDLAFVISSIAMLVAFNAGAKCARVSMVAGRRSGEAIASTDTLCSPPQSGVYTHE